MIGKTNQSGSLLLATLLWILGSGEAGARQVPPDKLSAFNIPRMSKPPTIDGVINADEWKESTAVSGVADNNSNELVPRPVTFFLAWDAGHLYVAGRSWLVPGEQLTIDHREPHTAAIGDTCFEFHFDPMGRNLPPSGGGSISSYKFFINPLVGPGLYHRVSVGQLFTTWLPKLQVKSTIRGNWWEFEMASSLQDFELARPQKAGDTWRLMLVRNFDESIWSQAPIAMNSGFFSPEGFPLATLVEGAPAVQMTMDDLPGPCDGKAAAKISVFNPSAAPITVKASIAFTELPEQSPPAILVQEEQSLTIPPGATEQVVVDKPFPRAVGKNLGSIEARVTDASGKSLFQYFTWFRQGYAKEWMTAVPPKYKFPLSVSFNPVRGNLFLRGDSYYLANKDDVTELRYKLICDRDGSVIKQGSVTGPRTWFFTALEKLPALAEGKYTIEAVLVDRNGHSIGPEKSTFEKLDESKAFGQWWTNKLGNTERVIKPFVAMTTARNTVSCWGRSYELKASGLPSRIESQNGQVLSSPARIVVQLQGQQPQVIPLNSAPTITEHKPWRVSFTGKTTGAGLEFAIAGTVEQDGLAIVDLTYKPTGGRPVAVEALRIEFPLRADIADNLVCIGPGGNYSAHSFLFLPNRQGRLWSTLDIGRLGSGMTVGSFFPCVWIGNEQRGFLWWGDSDKGWLPDDEVPAHEVVREGQEVILRNNIIGKPFTIDAPRALRFSYNASPFRPLVPGWRSSLWSADGTFQNYIDYKYRKLPDGTVFDGWNLLTPPSDNPAEWDALWAEYKRKSEVKMMDIPYTAYARNGDFVHTSVTTVGYGYKSRDARVTDYFAAEWGSSESYPPSNIDYYIWLADQAFTKGGLKTIYWDILFPMPHSSVQNGIAYRLPDGRVQPGYAGFNERRFLMRMYALMDEHGLTPGAQVAHATNAYLLPVFGWIDAVLDGEFHRLTDESTADWVDGYPPERMRSLSVAHNWGVAITWMDHIAIKNPVERAKVEAGKSWYLRLYDSWIPPRQVMEWGINDPRVEFIPFWRNGKYLKVSDSDLLVSMWRLPDRVLLCVYNYAKQARSATIHIDLDKLELVPHNMWTEHIGIQDIMDPSPGISAQEMKTTRSGVTLDFARRELTGINLEPRMGMLLSVRRY